ncbi:MAG: aminopeptidase [Clostridiales bacterium]|nr:aminopeptidase [Clostridiales bacterium]
MTDCRIEKLAKGLINYSVELKKGEKCLIEAYDIDNALVKALVKEVYNAGGYPFVWIRDNQVNRLIQSGLDENLCNMMADFDSYLMKEMDAYVGIRGGNNAYELSDVDGEKRKLYSSIYSNKVHLDLRVNKTKWVILRYPNPGMAQLAGMSTEAFEDFFFDVCTLDYSKMDKAMDALEELIAKTDKVRLVAKDTDLTFSIKGLPGIKCSGKRNIPDGEIFTAPVKDSVNGVITFNAPSIHDGLKFENVRLEFKDGKIINATANYTEKLNEILDIDEGARYVGEFSFGVNPFINNAIGDILFDEKIAGSIHFTPGSCYEECDNGNKSSLHWDMVLIQSESYGGGEIYFDDVLIRKNGLFVIDSLKCLNPDNLK